MFDGFYSPDGYYTPELYTLPQKKQAEGWYQDIERNPDKLKSTGGLWFECRGDEIYCVMEVRGCGAITMKATTGHADGLLRFSGLNIFTDEQIKFETEIDRCQE